MRNRFYRIFFVIICCFPSISAAELCPSASDIRLGIFYSFRPFNTDSGYFASEDEITAFKRAVSHFILAESSREPTFDGEARCYYQLQNEADSQVYLASQLLIAAPSPYWRAPRPTIQRCNGQRTQCVFKMKTS